MIANNPPITPATAVAALLFGLVVWGAKELPTEESPAEEPPVEDGLLEDTLPLAGAVVVGPEVVSLVVVVIDPEAASLSVLGSGEELD